MTDWRKAQRNMEEAPDKFERCRDLTGYDCNYKPKSPRDFENHLLDEHPEGNKK